MQNSSGGYVMLLLLMIGVVLIVTLIVRTDIFGGGDKGMLERGQDAIDEANRVKMKLESNYRFDPDALEQSIDSMP